MHRLNTVDNRASRRIFAMQVGNLRSNTQKIAFNSTVTPSSAPGIKAVLVEYVDYSFQCSRLLALLAIIFMASGCATQSVDPLKGMYRGVHAFNDTADRFLLRPIATGYRAVLPKPVELGIANVFSNAAEPWVAINQLLQGKPRLFLGDTGRFLVNTTLGIAGLFDVAARIGLEEHDEDFGQTLAVWGVGKGAYIVIPFWGPSTIRDGLFDIVGSYAYLPRYIEHVPTRNVVFAIDIINQRAQLLDAERLITGDRYLFIRDAYLQRREYLIKDGVVEDSFLDEDL